MVTWYINDYKNWFKAGFPENENVHVISILNCAMLSPSDDVYNIRIPPEIGRLKNLKVIAIDKASISSFPEEFSQLQGLRYLSIRRTFLPKFPEVFLKLKNLEELDLESNKLLHVPPEIYLLKSLRKLTLSSNNLKTVPNEICRLENLTKLNLCNNELSSIPAEVGNLRNLSDLWLSNNNLTTIPVEVGFLQARLFIDGNPIEYLHPNVIRLQKKKQGIYRDEQSVHDSNIQKTLRESIVRLFGESSSGKEVLTSILSDEILSSFTKESLIEYDKDKSVHSILNVTFSEVLSVVWRRIVSSPHSSQIKEVLNTEMADSECKCFTGRISRLVNCLNGFDPLVNIQISDNEQIGNIISVVKRQLEEKNEYTVEKHKELARERLRELKISSEEIEKWFEFIEEEDK